MTPLTIDKLQMFNTNLNNQEYPGPDDINSRLVKKTSHYITQP